MNDKEALEKIAFQELQAQVSALMFNFIDKYSGKDNPNNLYPKVGYILVDVLTSCLNDAQTQSGNYRPFTERQNDQICFNIGLWYSYWKDKMWVEGKPNQHWLGVAKEQLKTLICGD